MTLDAADAADGIVPDAVDMREVKRVLVVKLRHHGDVLLASPVISVLKAHAPHVTIDALVYGDTVQMLDLHPAIGTIHVVDRGWRELGPIERAKREWGLLSALRSASYDLLVHLTDHPRGAWLARALPVRASVAPARASRWWKKSFTHRYPVVGGGRRHTVELNLDALRRIGIQPSAAGRGLTLQTGEPAAQHADALLARHGLAPKAFIQIHPTSRWRFKCWPADYVAAVIDNLESRGHRIVLTAAPDPMERAFVAEVLARMQTEPVDLSGELTLKQLAALTARAKLFIGVDSAPMHIAAAMRTPTVAIFGPSGDIEWGPWQVPHRIVAANEFPCRPCGYDGCGGGKVSECLTGLAPARVLAAVDELLAI